MTVPQASYPGGPIPYRDFNRLILTAGSPANPAKNSVLLLHGGGDSPGMNAALEGAVIGLGRLGWEPWAVLNGWSGLTDPLGQFVRVTQTQLNGIRLWPSSLPGTGVRHKSPIEKIAGVENPLEIALGHLAKFQGLIVMGGNGSGFVSETLVAQHSAKIVFIPATVDGDFLSTKTLGFDSAVDAGKKSLQALSATSMSCGKVMVVEIMGGASGALALGVAAAGGADYAIVPEVPIDLQQALYPRIQTALDLNKNFVIVVGESADWTNASGERFLEQGSKGLRPVARKIGEALAHTIQQECRVSTQHNAPLHQLRGADPVSSDILGGMVAGLRAAQLVSESKYNVIVPVDVVPSPTIPLVGFFTDGQSLIHQLYVGGLWQALYG